METFQRYWPSVRGIHRWAVNSPHKGQWRGDLLFLWSAPRINGWVKQSWGWWFETPSRSLWRHFNESTSLAVFVANPLIWAGVYWLWSVNLSVVGWFWLQRYWWVFLNLVHFLTFIETCPIWIWYSTGSMRASSNGNIFRFTVPLCGEFTGHRWIPHTKASDAEL